MFLNYKTFKHPMFTKLNFGTAGVPISSKSRNIIDGIDRLKKLTLDNMEIEFVRQVYIKEENAAKIKEFSEKNNILLTCHGQYYINLNSKEKEKQDASKTRIYDAAKIAYFCGAKSITFHAGFYQGMDKEKTYQTIKENMIEILERLKKDKINITIRPETTGKPTQFGSLNELVRLSKELREKGYDVLPCVDFAHLHARSGGGFNSEDEFESILKLLKSELDCLDNMHIHLAGINYSEKGERNHLCLEDSDMNWKTLLKVWKKFDIKGIVTCESPNIEEDALLLRKYYNNLK